MSTRCGVGRNQYAHRDLLDDIAWLRENGYARATNRQLAERLGISLKALEHHLYDERYREVAA
jgi:hypothetical protein